jgi:HSP20 family protein
MDEKLLADFHRIRVQMEQSWLQMVGSLGSRFCPPTIEPLADVYDNGAEVVVLIELAGLNAEQVDIRVEGRTLIFSGARQPKDEHSGRRYSQMEICYGPFERRLLLPAEVDADKTKAGYNEGLLEIVLPKIERKASSQVRFADR